MKNDFLYKDLKKMKQYMKICEYNAQNLKNYEFILNKNNKNNNNNKYNNDIHIITKTKKIIAHHLDNLLDDVLIIKQLVNESNNNKNTYIKLKKNIVKHCGNINNDILIIKQLINNLNTIKQSHFIITNDKIQYYNINEHFGVNDIVDPIIKPIKSGFDSMTNEVNKIKDTTTSIGNDIGNATKGIIDSISKTITEQFSEITNFFVNFGKQITSIFNLIINKFEEIGAEIVKIGKTIENLGEMFYNKFLKPLFNEVFGAMKSVFEFIVKDIIPLLKKIVEFLFEYVPKTVTWMYNTSNKFFNNFAKTYIISPILFIFIFFGLQLYLKFIFGLEASVPPVVVLVIVALVIFDQILNNVNNLIIYQKIVEKYLVKLFSIDSVKRFFNLPINFGKDIINDFIILLKEFTNNPTKFIVFMLLLLLVIKLIINYIKHKIYNYIS